MTYNDIADMIESGSLIRRIQACAWKENVLDPGIWVNDNIGRIVARSDWEADWASAVAAGNPNPGADPSVVTDGAILSAVQALVTLQNG